MLLKVLVKDVAQELTDRGLTNGSDAAMPSPEEPADDPADEFIAAVQKPGKANPHLGRWGLASQFGSGRTWRPTLHSKLPTSCMVKHHGQIDVLGAIFLQQVGGHSESKTGRIPAKVPAKEGHVEAIIRHKSLYPAPSQRCSVACSSEPRGVRGPSYGLA